MAEFGDGKDEGALRTIGEVSDALGIKPHVLRYWEQQFPLLQPLKRSGGRRYYRPADVAMVKVIEQLINHEGYTRKGAETVMRAMDKGELDRRMADRRGGATRDDAIANVSPAPRAEARIAVDDVPPRDEVIAGLKAVRTRLARALEA
jgi:DNA-binding transcriptional MerR regulator